MLKTPDNNYLWPTPSLYSSFKKLKCIISSILHLKSLSKLVLIINFVLAHHSFTLSSCSLNACLSRFIFINTFTTLYLNKEIIRAGKLIVFNRDSLIAIFLANSDLQFFNRVYCKMLKKISLYCSRKKSQLWKINMKNSNEQR